MRRRGFSFVIGIAALAVVASACGTFTGGGTNTSNLDGTKKVTFGFQTKCDERRGVFQGQLQWNDSGRSTQYPKGVAFHASMSLPVSSGDCSSASPDFGVYYGTYVPDQPKGTGGAAYAIYSDSGAQGHDPGDSIYICLDGGVLSGYCWGGSLANGTITYH